MQPRVLILSSALDTAPRSIHLARPMTVAEVVEAQQVALDLPTIAVISDAAGVSRPVMRGEWHVRQVTPGHQLAFVPVPAGGSLKSILSAVAGIALAVFAPWAAGALAGAMGFTAGTAAFNIASGLIGAGIMIAGQFVLNRLLPQQSNTGLTAESVYTARASSNRAMPNEVIPGLYGLLRYPPPYAARPYAEFVDNDQYLYQLHCLSVGYVDPKQWEIGDTLVWTAADGFQGSFAGGDTQIEIIRPGDQIKLFPANVVTASTVDGQQVPDSPEWLGPFAVSAPGTKVNRIACDYVFTLGLVHINKKGKASHVSRTVTAQYRRIDNSGNPIGSWATLFSVEHNAATRTPQRFSKSADVPNDRYEVRFGASGADNSDDTGSSSTLNRIVWAGLRGYVEGFVTPPNVTLVATRIRATEHLSSAASGQYLFTCQRRLPRWSASTGWSAPVATRNPAWAVADMLRSLGIADDEYDLGWLATYANLWETRGDRFDALFDRRWQASEALDAILRAGRSYHVRLGSIIGFVRDEPRQVKRMAFGPDSVVRGSIRRHDVWFSEDAPDHLEVVYLDGETWTEKTVVTAIGAIGHDKPQQLSLFGITGHDHAWREGIFQTGENAYRRSFRTFQVEREGRMLVRGDAVVLADPLHELAGFARIRALAGNVLTLDRPFELDGPTPIKPSETYHVQLRDRFGKEWGPCKLAAIDGDTVTLDAADRAIVEAQHGPLANRLPNTAKQEPAHVTLLAGEDQLFSGLLVEARPVGSEHWEITLVNDDQTVHTLDQTEIKPSPWTPPAMVAPAPDKPALKGLYASLQRGTLVLELHAGWQPAPGAEYYVGEISYDDDAAVLGDAATWTPVHNGAATRLIAQASPQPVTLRVAPIGKLQGDWSYTSVVAVPGLYLPDEVVDPILQKAADEVADQMDWMKSDSPLFGLGQQVIGNGDAIVAERAERMVEVGVLASRARDLQIAIDKTVFALAETNLAQKRELVLVREDLVSVDESARTFALDQINQAVGPGSAVVGRMTAIEAQAATDYAALTGAIQTVQQTSLDAVTGLATSQQAMRIQLVGGYTGNDINQVTDGLLYQSHQGWISETQAIVRSIDQIVAGVGNASLFDPIREWSWTDTVAGWTGNGAPTVTNGWLRPADHASDPYLVSPAGLAVNGARYKQVRLYVRKFGAPDWEGYLWWRRVGDTTWDASRRVSITEAVYLDDQGAITLNVDWSGTIDSVRLDLSAAQTASAGFELKNFMIGEPSPGASRAMVTAIQDALASQILAEAGRRETLSVILTGLADPTGATLPDLTQGLIHEEALTRAEDDAAITSLVAAVIAQLENPVTGLNALAQAQTTTRSDVSALGDEVSAHTSAISDLVAGIATLDNVKANTSITDAIKATVEQMGGGMSTAMLASAIRSLNNTLDQLAFAQSGLVLAGKSDRNKMSALVAQVDQQATSRIDATDDQVTLHGQILDRIRLDMGGLAGLDLVQDLAGRVTTTESGIENIGTRLVSINGSIDTLQTGKANVQAVNDLGTRIIANEEGLQALSQALIDVNTSVGRITVGGRLKMESLANSADGWNRIGFLSSADNGVSFAEAALLLESRTSGTVRSRVALKSAQTVIIDSQGNVLALFGDDGVTMQSIRLGDLEFDRLKSRNGKLFLRGYDDFADIRMFT